MGHISHRAIVVTGEGPKIADARDFAVSLKLPVSALTPGLVNGFASFFVAPDGGKYGHETQERCQTARETFTQYLSQQTRLEWVSVAFGSDDGHARVVASPWGEE